MLPDVGIFIRQLRSNGFDGIVAGCDGFDDPSLEETVGNPAYLDKVIFATHGVMGDGGRIDQFIAACKAAGYKVNGIFDALGADMVQVVYDAAKASGSEDPVVLREAIRASDGSKTVMSDNLSFKEKLAYPVKTIPVIGFKDGKRVVIVDAVPAFVPYLQVSGCLQRTTRPARRLPSAPDDPPPDAPALLTHRTGMLVVENLVVRYGPITAVRGRLDRGRRRRDGGPPRSRTAPARPRSSRPSIGLVPSTGRVSFDGRDVSALSPEERVRSAMTVVPEGRRVFANLTVAENLRLGGFVRRRDSDLDSERDRYLAMFPVLRERLDQLAGTLSGGEQQMLAIARAMMSKPRLLILDEPSLGLAPRIVARIFEHIVELKKSGITIVLVEQNMMQALAVADRAYVLSTGTIRHAGPAAELRADPRLADLAIGGH